eukprot:COSAG01_NODE_1888_length_8979_cov_78.343806_4_plen_78_part_00
MGVNTAGTRGRVGRTSPPGGGSLLLHDDDDGERVSLRVQAEMIGSHECRIAGDAQSGLLMIDPIISSSTHTPRVNQL